MAAALEAVQFLDSGALDTGVAVGARHLTDGQGKTLIPNGSPTADDSVLGSCHLLPDQHIGWSKCGGVGAADATDGTAIATGN